MQSLSAAALPGLLSTAGFTRTVSSPLPVDAIHMTFGHRVFFAYAVSNQDEVWWFNNIAQATEPLRNELNQSELASLKERLLTLHAKDPAPIASLIREAHSIEIYPIYDIPFLPQWHLGRICLIGDAAHATAPHIGQGASLALEDTLVATCRRASRKTPACSSTMHSRTQTRAYMRTGTTFCTGSKQRTITYVCPGWAQPCRTPPGSR